MRRDSRPLPLALLIFAASWPCRTGYPQSSPAGVALTTEVKERVVRSLIEKVNAEYVFPGVAQEIKRDLIARLQRGDYAQVTDAGALAGLLTIQLRDISHDKHLGVEYDPQRTPIGTSSPNRTAVTQEEERRRFAKSINFCFDRVERMPGNVQQVEIRCFSAQLQHGRSGSSHINSFSGKLVQHYR
jgi:retinol-binding protein 3